MERAPDAIGGPPTNRAGAGGRWRSALAAGLALLLPLGAVAACGSSDDDTDVAGPEADAAEENTEPTPADLAQAASTAMAEIDSAAFEIEQTGADIFIDQAGQVAFQSADGHYASPGSAEAVVAVEAAGFLTEVGAVAIDGDLWMTDPLSGQWAVAPEQFAFDPSALFDPDEGLAAMLAEGAPGAELIEGDAEAAGRTHLRMDVAGARVAAITSGLITADTEVDLLIDPDTNRLEELSFDTPVGDATSSWHLALDEYDAEVTIEPPDLAGS